MKFSLKDFLELDTKSLFAVNGGSDCGTSSSPSSGSSDTSSSPNGNGPGSSVSNSNSHGNSGGGYCTGASDEKTIYKNPYYKGKDGNQKGCGSGKFTVGGTCGNINGGNDKTVESPSNDSDKNSLAKVANKISFPLGEEFSNEFQITSQFGNRDSFMTDNGETLPFHSGIDISVAEGTRINSVSDGVVTEVNYSDSLGNYVVVHHDNGTEKGVYTRYAHCGDVDVGVGTVVVAGEQIASVGMTGKTTGPHLHLSYDGDGDGNYASSEADNPLRILGY